MRFFEKLVVAYFFLGHPVYLQFNVKVWRTKLMMMIVRDKSRLWKRADRLAFERRVRKSNCWVSSDDILNCTGCQAEFTVTIRKARFFQCCCHELLKVTSVEGKGIALIKRHKPHTAVRLHRTSQAVNVLDRPTVTS